MNELRPSLVHMEVCFSATPIKAKIAEAEKGRIRTMLAIGGRDVDAGNVSVRLHSNGPQEAKPKGEVVQEIFAAIWERKA